MKITLVCMVYSLLALPVCLAADAPRNTPRPVQMTKAAASPVKPNILLMVGDDIGWGDIGCYGSTQIKTPNIDRMAKEGLRFTSGCVTAALCSSSRAVLLAGRYQQRNSLENNRLAESKDAGLDLNLKTLADVSGGAGYATGLIGKWHPGSGANKEFILLRRGFQEFSCIPAASPARTWQMPGRQGRVVVG